LREPIGTGMVLGTVFEVDWICLTILTALLLTYSNTYFNYGVITVLLTITILFYYLSFLLTSVYFTILVIFTTRVTGYLTVRL
jgi:hypothetical protein